MDIRRRTIQGLEKKKEETQVSLQKLYVSAGRALLVKENSLAGQERIASFNFINKVREENTRLITEIQQITARREDLHTQNSAVKKQIDDLNGQWSERLDALGTALYDHYTADYASSFGIFFTEASGEKTTLAEQQARSSAIQKEMEAQGFFSKLVTQVKLLSVNSSINQLNKKIIGILTRGAQAVMDSGSLASSYASGVMDAVLAHAYERCLSLREEIAGRKEYLQTLLDEDDKCREQLSALRADSPSRRIEELRSEIRKREKEQEVLCAETGLTAVNMYIDTAGKIISAWADEAAAAADFFPDIIQKRVQVLSFSRRIEILELTGTIESEEKRISSMQGCIADNERRIRQLKEENRDLTKKIDSAEKLKEELFARRGSLELLEGDSVKLIEEN